MGIFALQGRHLMREVTSQVPSDDAGSFPGVAEAQEQNSQRMGIRRLVFHGVSGYVSKRPTTMILLSSPFLALFPAFDSPWLEATASDLSDEGPKEGDDSHSTA
jgi:hypothetical protein